MSLRLVPTPTAPPATPQPRPDPPSAPHLRPQADHRPALHHPADQLLAKDVGRSKLSQSDADAIRSRIRGVTALEELGECEFAIEAVSESLPLKQKIFAQLATHLSPTAVLASNTSSISLTAIAAAALSTAEAAKGWNDVSPQRVVGVHFFNPVPVSADQLNSKVIEVPY